MKNPIASLVSRSLLILLLTCGVAVAEDGPRLQQLKYTVISPTVEQVTLQLNGSYSPKVFTLKGESPRVIFDFADMVHSREIKPIITTNGTIVKRIRVGMHTDGSPKTRVVFDLPSLQGVNYSQKFDDKQSTLTIQFTGPAKPTPAAKSQQSDEAKQAETTPIPPATRATAPAPEPTAPKTESTPSIAEPSAPQQKNPFAGSVEPAAPTAEAVTAPKTESVKPTEKIAATAGKEAKKTAADKKAVEKAAATKAAATKAEAAKPEEQKTEPSVEAKPAESAKTAIPPAEKTADKPVAPPTPELAKEEKKPEAPAKEAAPAKAAELQAATKIVPPPAVDKDKAEPAKPGPAAVQTSDSPQLEYVKFDATTPKGEMVMFKLNGFHPPAVHGVEEGIPRVICEFNNTKLADNAGNLLKTDGKFVKVIRTTKTKKPDKVKVVIDLEPNRSYDLQQVFFKDDNLFVIIVNTVKK